MDWNDIKAEFNVKTVIRFSIGLLISSFIIFGIYKTKHNSLDLVKLLKRLGFHIILWILNIYAITFIDIIPCTLIIGLTFILIWVINGIGEQEDFNNNIKDMIDTKNNVKDYLSIMKPSINKDDIDIEKQEKQPLLQKDNNVNDILSIISNVSSPDKINDFINETINVAVNKLNDNKLNLNNRFSSYIIPDKDRDNISLCGKSTSDAMLKKRIRRCSDGYANELNDEFKNFLNEKSTKLKNEEIDELYNKDELNEYFSNKNIKYKKKNKNKNKKFNY